MKAFFDPLYRTRYLGTQVLQPFNHSTPSPLTLNSFSALFQYAIKVSQHWHHSTFWEHYHLLCICLLLVNKSLRLFGAESDFSRAPHFAVWNDPDLASKSTLLEVWGFFFFFSANTADILYWTFLSYSMSFSLDDMVCTAFQNHSWAYTERH